MLYLNEIEQAIEESIETNFYFDDDEQDTVIYLEEGEYNV